MQERRLHWLKFWRVFKKQEQRSLARPTMMILWQAVMTVYCG
jgi:hypothetical protein